MHGSGVAGKFPMSMFPMCWLARSVPRAAAPEGYEHAKKPTSSIREGTLGIAHHKHLSFLARLNEINVYGVVELGHVLHHLGKGLLKINDRLADFGITDFDVLDYGKVLSLILSKTRLKQGLSLFPLSVDGLRDLIMLCIELDAQCGRLEINFAADGSDG